MKGWERWRRRSSNVPPSDGGSDPSSPPGEPGTVAGGKGADGGEASNATPPQHSQAKPGCKGKSISDTRPDGNRMLAGWLWCDQCGIAFRESK